MEDCLKQQKSALRKEVLKRRDALSVEERKKASDEMTKALLQQELFCESENILCFVSYGSEINTFPFMKEVLRCGKKLYVPKVVGDEMIFVRISSFDDLEPGYKGIPEPKACFEFDVLENTFDTEQSSFFIMPGVAFDHKNHRMGYGKGFYDRFLEKKEILLSRSVAVGFACQMVEEVPFDEYDKKPAEVLQF